MIRTLVVDDEPLARELLVGYVNQTPALDLAGSCQSGIEALSALRDSDVDLLFLDIQMPLLNGLELSRMLDPRTRVVFTTAFEQYALEGFRVDALDYLLKPISYAEFLRAVGKAQRWFDSETTQAQGSGEVQSIFVKSDYKMVQMRLADILYVEGMKDYVRIHTEDAVVVTQMSMRTIEDSLPGERFVRVHRSYVVNMDRIGTIDRNRIVFGKVYIPVSDSYRERFMEILSKRSLLL